MDQGEFGNRMKSFVGKQITDGIKIGHLSPEEQNYVLWHREKYGEDPHPNKLRWPLDLRSYGKKLEELKKKK